MSIPLEISGDSVAIIDSSSSSGNSESTYTEYSPAEDSDYDTNNNNNNYNNNNNNNNKLEEAECSSSQGRNTDGLYCSICLDAWSNGGDHQLCCLPCGHLFGARCIKKWLQHRKSSKKCPQCNSKCTLKDVRLLYAPQIVVVDHELQKKIETLEAKCSSLEKKDQAWLVRESSWRKRESDLLLQINQLTKASQESSLQNIQCGSAAFSNAGLNDTMFKQGSGSNFKLKNVFSIDDAKLFDLDASNKVIIFARRLTGLGGRHTLMKMSLIAPKERETIPLPANTKAIRDLRTAPDGKLALLACAGKKLTVMSTESNNIVLQYDLPVAGWSCSWDHSNSFHMYTGLQNGMLMVFDMRQTSRPVHSIVGLTSNPIHSAHCLSPDSSSPAGVKSFLTASSAGLCQWSIGDNDILRRPYLVPQSLHKGVCIACAYSPNSNNIVASFRPEIVMPGGDVSATQLSVTPDMGQGLQGTHVLLKKKGDLCYETLNSTSMNVDNIRLPRSAIVEGTDQNEQFACGDDLNCELVLQELPSLVVSQHFKAWNQPIRDVRYTPCMGLLSCLSDGKLQIFSQIV